jgi:hypothetical protein
MPAPDLARPSRVEAKLITQRPTNATAITVLTCPANATIRLRTVYVTNTLTTAQVFTLSINRGTVGGGGGFAMHAGVTIPAKALFNATTIDDAVYLEEGDSIAFSQAATTVALNLFVSYELVT